MITPGVKCGRWRISKPATRDITGKLRYLCQCDCGTRRIVLEQSLITQKSRSCGCRAEEKSLLARRLAPTKKSWSAMLRRCYVEKAINYPDYGGRGIKVCRRWRQSFQAFYSDMGDRPHGKQLDRIDNEGHYKKSNCQWSSPTKNSNNKRNNVKLSFKGRTLSIMQWSRVLGVSWSTLYSRHRRGWSTVRILSQR